MDQNTHTNADYADNADYDSANLNAFWRDFSSLPCHIVFKDLSKLIICSWISLRLET